jgi:DNA-binding transcriptional MocR family regulator
MWLPQIAGRPGPRYLAIADAIGEGVADGSLGGAAKLPPQRHLAYGLGVSLSTVTRAYAEAQRRGLVHGQVGRGTFVRAAGPGAVESLSMLFQSRAGGGLIDLTMNLPAVGDGPARLAETLAQLSGAADLGSLLDDRVQGGADGHTAAGAAWIGRLGLESSGDEVVLTIGAQHGVLVSLMATTRPGDLVLTESLTYPPLKQIARHLDLTLHPLEIDQHGLLPAALEAGCRKTSARVLYCMPTLHSPTTATLPDERRRRIAEIARRHDLTIIEDDVFGFLPEQRPLPLAAFAPERTLFVTSMSKGVAPWLRVGYVRVPDKIREAIATAVHMSCWMPPTLMAEIARRWIEDGTADRLASWQRGEAKARQGIARRVLGRFPYQADPCGLHLWLGLPEPWGAEAFRVEAERRGVKVLSGELFAVGKAPAPHALRLALGRETSRERLSAGLETVAELLGATVGPGLSVV